MLWRGEVDGYLLFQVDNFFLHPSSNRTFLCTDISQGFLLSDFSGPLQIDDKNCPLGELIKSVRLRIENQICSVGWQAPALKLSPVSLKNNVLLSASTLCTKNFFPFLSVQTIEFAVQCSGTGILKIKRQLIQSFEECHQIW